ncbi:hypothetical protein MTR_7g034795 [Medicago truncatula]|uniref:Uncharacterized protein n=1 Tax=Medicago truncatula TaxID=3880 RepID=A0A072TXS7_MEDTR|nr:hypothetical protein MTR_7g034795 [Medicago truncatula]
MSSGLGHLPKFPECRRILPSLLPAYLLGPFATHVCAPSDEISCVEISWPHFPIVPDCHDLLDGGLNLGGEVPRFVDEIQFFQHYFGIGSLVEGKLLEQNVFDNTTLSFDDNKVLEEQMRAIELTKRKLVLQERAFEEKRL